MVDLGKLSYDITPGDFVLVQKVINQTGAVEKPYLYRVEKITFENVPEIEAYIRENGQETEKEVLSGFYDEYVAMALGHWKHSPSDMERNEAEKHAIEKKNLNDREVRALINELQAQE